MRSDKLKLKEFDTNPFNDISEFYQIWDNTLDFHGALALTLGKLFSYDMKDIKKLRKSFHNEYYLGFRSLVYKICDRGMFFYNWIHSYINNIEEVEAFFRGIYKGVSALDKSVSTVSDILLKTWEAKKWSLEYLESEKNYVRRFATIGRYSIDEPKVLFPFKDENKYISPDEAINLLVEDIEKYERSCGPSGRKIEID